MTKDCTPIEYCNRFMEGKPCECFPTAAICQACNKDLSEHVRCHCPWQAMWRSPSGADYRKIDDQWRLFIGLGVRWQSSTRVPPLTAEILDSLAAAAGLLRRLTTSHCGSGEEVATRIDAVAFLANRIDTCGVSRPDSQTFCTAGTDGSGKAQQ
jgi:hypothetical protein